MAGFGIWYMLNFLFPVGLPQSYYRNGTIRIVSHSAFWCLSVCSPGSFPTAGHVLSATDEHKHFDNTAYVIHGVDLHI
jgi:hypothetical protein